MLLTIIAQSTVNPAKPGSYQADIRQIPEDLINEEEVEALKALTALSTDEMRRPVRPKCLRLN